MSPIGPKDWETGGEGEIKTIPSSPERLRCNVGNKRGEMHLWPLRCDGVVEMKTYNINGSLKDFPYRRGTPDAEHGFVICFADYYTIEDMNKVVEAVEAVLQNIKPIDNPV